MLAPQDILTYFPDRSLPYLCTPTGAVWLVFAAFSTSASLSKILFRQTQGAVMTVPYDFVIFGFEVNYLITARFRGIYVFPAAFGN